MPTTFSEKISFIGECDECLFLIFLGQYFEFNDRYLLGQFYIQASVPFFVAYSITVSESSTNYPMTENKWWLNRNSFNEASYICVIIIFLTDLVNFLFKFWNF